MIRRTLKCRLTNSKGLPLNEPYDVPNLLCLVMKNLRQYGFMYVCGWNQGGRGGLPLLPLLLMGKGNACWNCSTYSILTQIFV